MAVPVKRRAPATKAAKQKPLTVKASGTGASDQDIFSATIADANAGRTSTREQQWFCYEKHPWVRACVRLIANAVSQEGFAVSQIEGASFHLMTEEEDPRIKEILQFFRYAFAGKSLRMALVSLVTDLEVFGLGYWLIRRQGDLIWYERQDVRLMTPVLNSERTEIVSYIIKRASPGGVGALLAIDSSAGAKTVDAKDVIRFAFEGGDAVHGGPSPLEALDLTVAMDLSIRHHRNAFFRNGATHGTYILLPEASPEQAEEFTKSIMGLKVGASKAYAPLVIAGQSADVKKFAESGKNEVDFVKGSELTRDEIAAVYAIPLGKLMFASGALGSAGKSEDDDTFQRDCVLPIEELIYETLTAEILVKEFEIDDLALIPKRRASVRTDRFAAALQLVKFGGTANEARELAGLPKVDDPKMDEPLFLGAGGATSADPGLTKENAPATPAAGADPSTGAIDGANTAQDGKTKDEVPSRKGASSRFQHLRRRLDAVQQRAIASKEGKLAAKLVACRHSFARDFWRLAGDVKAATTAPKPISHTEVLALTRAIMDAEGDSVSDAIYDSSEIMVELGWSQGKSILDLTTGFDVVPTATLRRLKDDLNAYESKLDVSERDAVRHVLAQAFTDGLSVPQTKDLIKEAFESVHATDDEGNVTRTMPLDDWAQMTARTELSAASASGMRDLYLEAGIQRLQWISSLGQNACDDCTDADGEVVDIGSPFPFVDVDANPAHCNCVCSTAPADDEIGDFRTGGQEQTEWSARGGHDAKSFEETFGFKHPIDEEE